jgi:chemotaxis protein CheD
MMTDGPRDLPMVYLQPGEIHMTRSPAILKTVLGSCVGVTFWSLKLGTGALCHAVLPRMPNGAPAVDGGRYVDFAIRDMAGRFDRLGALRSEVQVKVFGGADMLSIQASDSRRASVGRQNWQTALDILAAENLTVIASDVGGPIGRTVEFHSGTGEVLLRRLTQINGDPW